MSARTQRLPPWVARWAAKGSWAVADQAFFALSQFITGVMLARWLTPPAYGAYALLYGVFLFVGSIHSALLTEPMLVFGSSRFALRPYLRALVRAHFGMTLAAGVCLLLVVVFMQVSRGQAGATARAMAALAVAQPAILLAWVYRRACYLRGDAAAAASGGALHLGIVVAGLAGMRYFELVSVPNAFLMFGCAGLGASLWLAWRLRRTAAPDPGGPPVPSGAVLTAHWSYGRWSLLTGLISWASYNLYFFLLPGFAGLAATGAFKALLNVVMPATHAIAALSFLLLPTLARQGDRDAFRSTTWRAAGVFVAGSMGYAVVAGIWWEPMLRLLYGESYLGYVRELRDPGFLWLIALLPVGAACVAVFGSALRALERSDKVFRAYLLSGVAGTVAGVAAVAGLGLEGAMVGTALYTCLTTLALYHHLREELAAWSRKVSDVPVASPGGVPH